MRAAFFESKGTISVREVPSPEPSPDDVRLSVSFCGICGSDLSLFKTGALAGPDTILGHEIVGVVDCDPSGEWENGSRVVPFPARGCGRCMWCAEGKWRYCLEPSPTPWGGFAEQVVFPRRNLIRVPVGLDDRAAAAAEPLGVALRGVELAPAAPGDLAYVSGLGPLGLFTVTGLASVGCRVVGADPNGERRAKALELGCGVVFDPTLQDPAPMLREVDSHGPSVAFECSGAPGSLEQVLDVCAPEGTIGILGIPMAPVFLLRMTILEQRAFAISGPSWESMHRALDMLEERPGVAGVVTGSVPLDALGPTMGRLLEGREGLKVLAEPHA